MKYIRPITARAASGRVKEVYSQIRREFGILGEPHTLHAGDPDLLTGVWVSFRESILAGIAPRQLKEAVSVAVSRSNQCPYCMDAHMVMLWASSTPDSRAIFDGRCEEIRDPDLRKIAQWAGATRTPDAEILAQGPFPPAYAPEIVGTALWIHYINRMVTIFIGGRLLPAPVGATPLRHVAFRLGGAYFRRAVNRPLQPGASLPANGTALPDDLRWAAGSPSVARAWAFFATAAEQAGAAALTPRVKALTSDFIAEWRGEDPGMGTNWLETAIRPLEIGQRPAARFVLLTAMAPYRVDESIVGAFVSSSAGPKALLGAAAWASFTAARRIGSWLRWCWT